MKKASTPVKPYVVKSSNLFVCSDGQIVKLPLGEIKLLTFEDGWMSYQASGNFASDFSMSPKDFKAFSDAVLENQQGGVAL